MLCVSIVLLDLLSFSLISCVHHRNFVGGVFFYMLLTSNSLCKNNLSNMAFIAELSLRTMYPMHIKLQ